MQRTQTYERKAQIIVYEDIEGEYFLWSYKFRNFGPYTFFNFNYFFVGFIICLVVFKFN